MSGFGGFREVARAITTGYPLPFLFTLLLAFSGSCFVTAAAVSGAFRWAMFATGLLTAVVTISLAVWIVLRRPALLCHERIELIHRTLDIIGDNDLSAEVRQSVSDTMTGLLTGTQTHKPKRITSFKTMESDEHG